MKRSRLVVKSAVLIAAALLPLFTGFSVLTAIQRKNAIIRGMEREINSISQLLPAALIQPMMNSALAQVRFVIWNIAENETIAGVRVSDLNKVIGEVIEDNADQKSHLKKTLPIVFDDKIHAPIPLGEVELLFTDTAVKLEILKDVRNSVIQSVTILTAVMVMVIFLLSKVVVNPVRAATEKMKDISQGEADLRNRLPITSRDEIGDLAGHFNAFVANLDSLVGEIRVSLESTLAAQTELSANSEESAAAVVQITANIESANKQIDILNNNISRSSAIIGSIVGEIHTTMESIETQGTMVVKTVSSVTQLLGSIENVSTIVEREKESTEKLVISASLGGDKLEETGRAVEDINSSIEEIRQLLTLINGIAAQTNLLAMNAAIEAAHAGDAGRGFAVVADEIRKLAESSAKNAKNISGVLKHIIGRIETASISTRETTSAFTEIRKEITLVSDSLELISVSMTEMNAGSKDIHGAMGTLQKVSSTLKDRSQSMESGSQDLSRSITEIRNISGVVDGAMREIQEGIREINTAVVQVSEINSGLGQNARELGKKITRFRTSSKTAEDDISPVQI